jgi:hypothetical protein
MINLKDRAEKAKADGKKAFAVCDSIMIEILDLYSWVDDLTKEAKELGLDIKIGDGKVWVMVDT